MDWDLSSAPYDPEDNSLCKPLEWLLDFYFHYGLDVIEEDALKEKCCIQVLKILISKADTEIDELEQDLIFLQSELAWIENEEWSEIGYNALTEKIDSLDTSMKSLRNEAVYNVEVHLLMHTQPVERLHEVLHALLSNYFCKKDLQPTNAGVEDSSRHSLKLEAGFSVEVINSNSSCPISVKKGNGSKSGFNSKVQTVMQNFSSNCEDKGRHNAEKLEIQPTNVGGNDAISDASQHADDSSNVMNKLSDSDSSMASGDFEENSSMSTACLISCSPVKPMVIKTDAGEKDVDFGDNVTAEELECANELNGSGNADPGLGVFSDPGDQDGLLDFALTGKNEPTTEELKVAASKIVTPGLGMSSESGNQDRGFALNGKNEPTTEERKVAASEMVTPGLGMSSDPGNQDGLFGFALNGKNEPTTEELKVAASKMVTPGLGMSSDPGNQDGLFGYALNGKNEPTTEERKVAASEMVTPGLGMSSDPGNQDGLFGYALNGKDEPTTEELKVAASEIMTPGLGVSSKSGNQDGLFGFALNGKNEPTAEEVEVGASEIVTSLDSSVTTEREEKNPLQILKVVEAALSEKENCALTLLLEQQDKKGNNAMKVQPKEEEKTIPEVEMSLIAAREKFESNMYPDSPEDLQKEKMKGSMNSNPLNLPEVGVPTMIVDSSSSFVMKGKKRQKSVARTGSNPERKTVKKLVVEGGEFEFGENGDDKPNSVSLALKKTKSWNNTPLISELKSGKTESSDKDEVEPIPARPVMMKLKLQELRKIAKQHKIIKYYQMNKNQLVQLLACQNGGN